MAKQGIDGFKGNFQGGARGTLFEVVLSWPTEITSIATENLNEKLKFLCKGAALPASSIAELAIPYRGRDFKIAGKRTFENWQITVINDHPLDLRASFEAWSFAASEHGVFVPNAAYNNSNPGAFAGYMTDLQVHQLNHQHEHADVLNDGDMYSIIGAWPTNISAITLGSGEEGIEEFTVDFVYQYWQYGPAALEDSDGDTFGN